MDPATASWISGNLIFVGSCSIASVSSITSASLTTSMLTSGTWIALAARRFACTSVRKLPVALMYRGTGRQIKRLTALTTGLGDTDMLLLDFVNTRYESMMEIFYSY